MSQGIFNNIVATTTTGLMLTGLLDDFKDAVVSGFSGPSRPARIQAKGMWVDTSQEAAPNYYWSLKIYTGTTDIEIFRVSVLTGVSGFTTATGLFTVREVAADTAGAILNLTKKRIASGGQVLTGDTIGELRITGRTDTSTNPIVAYLRATASEDTTASLRGTTLSICSTPVGTNQLSEHLRFLAGVVESTLPYKVNALILGSDSVATAASLLLTSDKVVSELTGSTKSVVHGIEAGDAETRVKHIHNRSTAEIAIKHNSGTAGATERFKLSSGKDLYLQPEESMSFFYCETDTAWKYFAGGISSLRTFINTIPDGFTEWTAPLTGDVRIAAYLEATTEPGQDFAASAFSRSALSGLLAWGVNTHGQLGDGSVTPRSVPVAVVGGVRFRDADISGDSSGGITDGGDAYAWGANSYGQLGVGDTAARSSPVAVLGSHSFTRLDIGYSSYGLHYNGALYAWGFNDYGQLGVGDVAHRSSPVLVLGSHKFAAVFRGLGGGSTFGVERDTGALYAWGTNSCGELGTGDTVDRSSPVAVVGGLTFKKVSYGANSVVGLTSGGAAYAWGYNSSGELGDNSTVDKSSPVAVLGNHVFRDVFVLPGTGNSFYGLTESDDLYAWGFNGNGQLGDNSTVNKSSPALVVGGIKWEKLARLCSSNNFVIGIERGTGAAYAWGDNASGQLGDNSVTPRSSPVAVLGGHAFSRIVTGDGFAVGEAAGNNYYAWGNNASGQLGDNSVVSKSSPTLVQGCTEPMFQVPTYTVVPVVQGTTYEVRLGGGASFFGTTKIGTNIRRATIAFEK